MKSNFSVVFFCFLFAIVLISGCAQPQGPPTQEPVLGSPEKATYGELILKITDAKVEGLKVLNVTISGIEIHKTGTDDENWVTILEEEKTFDLMQLHGVAELLGEKELETGNYSQIRFAVINAELELEDGTNAEVIVPSNKVKVVKTFSIIDGSSTELTIDFKPDSVKKAGEKYIMTPVLKLMTPAEFQEHKKKIEEEKKGEEPQEGIDENAPALSPRTVIEDIGGTARFVASITDEPLQVILFQGNDKNFSPPGQQDKNKGKDNANQEEKPEAVDLNKMTALNITIGELSIHLSKSFVKVPDANKSVDDNSGLKKQNKWILLSDENKTFDLLQLETTEALLADLEIPAGKYTQIRLEVISASAVIDGNLFDVKVPPKKLMLHGVFDAKDQNVTFLSLDFDVEKSVHATGNGKIILRPAIRLKIVENATVTINNKKVKLERGQTVNESEQEFDEDGN